MVAAESVTLPALSAVEVKGWAREAGFDLVGMARAEPIPGDFLTAWLESGMAADMDWMAERTAERLDVTRLVPGARTVIALACNYHREDAPAQGSPIARYARGRDYHYTLQDRLRALRRAIRARRPKARTYSSVDHGAILEKVWAHRAGLGYVGKNGCLITVPFGSYVLLSAMVVSEPVDLYDEPAPSDRCGRCQLCIDACPTSAIVSARTVDAASCLSYQTIENAGAAVPLALRSALAETVFGCDVCQTVCPLNDTPVQAAARFVPRAVASLDTRALAALRPDEFENLARGTPLVRAGYHGLRRNAAYALGAARDRGAEPLLQALAQDPEPRVAEAARWALDRIGAAT